MQAKLAAVLIGMMCTASFVFAKNLGTTGQTYDILEGDFIQLIETRYQHMKTSGEWDRKQQAWQQKMLQSADRPRPVDSITTAQVNRTYHIDPSITLSRDIVNLDGRIIARTGTSVNPLAILPLRKTLLFINADDAKQVAWAITKNKLLEDKTKLIVVNGSIKQMVNKLQKAVYFDQGGQLTTHFKIKHVPAMLQQDGLLLKIEEVIP